MTPKAASAPSTMRSAGARRPRPRARRGEGDRLRDEILDAAEALLLETGSADKVSTRAVASRVGVSSPSLYLHFPDRASLLFEVCQRQFDKLAVLLAAACEGIDDPVERLRAIGEAYCRFAIDNPQQYRTMMMDVVSGVAYEKDLDEMRAEVGFDIVLRAVTDGIEAGVFATDHDPLLVAFAFWCSAHGLVSLMIAKPSIGWGDPTALIDAVLGQTLDGVRAR
ncbi:MAG: TetR/AcrR family transcriptional regulator [Acidimicrobiales bacterium]